jgi:hypothetical protein
MRTMSMSRIRSSHKNCRPTLSLTTLSKFSSLRSLLLCCHPRNRCTAAATCCPQSQPRSTPSPHPQPRSTPPPRPQPQSVPPLSSSSSSWLLSHCCRRPRLHLPRSTPPLSTLTPPPSEHAAAIVLDPDLPRYQALTCL